MATSVLRHSDDDGALSIFVSGDEILFVCEHRHWWTVKSGALGTAGKAAANRTRRGEVPTRLTAADKSLVSLKDRFGAGVFDVMSLK